MFQAMKLPYADADLQPVLSAETLEYHYGKHYLGYVKKLNELTKDTELAKRSLEELVKNETDEVFNMAAQVWNHEFYWKSMSSKGGGTPAGLIGAAIDNSFGDLEHFKEKFQEEALAHFGSGWAWLVKGAGAVLSIETTHDAQCPLRNGQVPILTCDLWEHAYYIDYRNDRGRYLEAWWDVVNWKFAAKNLDSTGYMLPKGHARTNNS